MMVNVSNFDLPATGTVARGLLRGPASSRGDFVSSQKTKPVVVKIEFGNWKQAAKRTSGKLLRLKETFAMFATRTPQQVVIRSTFTIIDSKQRIPSIP